MSAKGGPAITFCLPVRDRQFRHWSFGFQVFYGMKIGLEFLYLIWWKQYGTFAFCAVGNTVWNEGTLVACIALRARQSGNKNRSQYAIYSLT